MNKFKSLVLKAHGTNCEIETNYVLNHTGFNSEIIHINELLENPQKIQSYSFIVVPGGFSYGDYTGSGRIVASVIKHDLIKEIDTFINNGKLILGICNGFQILVKSGILPDINDDKTQNVSLIFNDSHKYEDRWVKLKVNKKSVFTKNAPDIIELPVAHAEGKFVYNEDIKNKIENFVVMKYIDENNNPTMEYPKNPNGSMNSIAAIMDKTGRIMGMMPHPERFSKEALYYNGNKEFTGTFIFENAYSYIKEEL